MKPSIQRCILILSLLIVLISNDTVAQTRTELPNPIMFVTQLPMPYDFMMITQSFGNHLGNVPNSGRGGDLYIYYPEKDSLKNLTALAGFGTSGFQGNSSIAVRDPQVHWGGERAIFSMVVGATEQQYQHETYYWQLYEITGLGIDDMPVITKVANQPADFNNISPFYGTDDRILFTSDRPRNGERHLYPQRDEYESAPTVTGIWSLDPTSGDLFLLNHAPSGSFSPFIDSYGRVLSTRWDHLQRDQQNYPGSTFGAFNWTDESVTSTKTASVAEVFPEPLQQVGDVNGHEIEVFFPWEMNEDGTGEELLNHLGRHELLNYFEPSFMNDDALDYFLYDRPNSIPIRNLFQMAENPTRSGEYFAINTPTFFRYTSGQIVRLYAPAGMNADSINIAPASAEEFTDGHYRHPRPLSNGTLIASHTDYKEPSDNIGTREAPESPYRFRIKVLNQNGNTWEPGAFITEGIYKPVQFWDPDVMVTYTDDIPMWELSPVEVIAKNRPAKRTAEIETPEMQIFQEENVDIGALRNFLKEHEMALVVSRNVTNRDAADKQQPYNLRVHNTNTETTGSNGIMYDVSHLQFFQGDQIRGYDGMSGGGRRVIAQPMHEDKGNMAHPGPAGSVEIASDGSIAAFVPARRAVTWQLVSPDEVPVVRERYWLNFQPGEIRSCGGCHGANTQAQDGSPLPTNPPEALRTLMQHYQESPTDVASEATPADSPILLGNYPNPFSEKTVIRYALAKAGHVSLRLFTITGREVRTLVDEFQPAGAHIISWQPENESSGMYVYQLQTDGKTATQKMVFNK